MASFSGFTLASSGLPLRRSHDHKVLAGRPDEASVKTPKACHSSKENTLKGNENTYVSNKLHCNYSVNVLKLLMAHHHVDHTIKLL